MGEYKKKRTLHYSSKGNSWYQQSLMILTKQIEAYKIAEIKYLLPKILTFE